MNFKVITNNSPEYAGMVDLRNRILRHPLGQECSAEDLAKDNHDLLLVASYPNSEQLTGCCILTRINEHTVQLRQMAIDNHCQGKGLGAEMLTFAESVAREHHYRYVFLHARKVAVDFYKKNGYTIEGDQYMEIGIPHFDMLKCIQTKLSQK